MLSSTDSTGLKRSFSSMIQSGIYRLFNSLFNIKPEEFKLVQLFFMYIALICAAYTINSTAAVTLFLSRVSEISLHELLPWLYISIAVTMSVVIWFYRKLIDRFSRIKLITWTTVFFISSFILIRILIAILGDRTGLYFFLMVWDETASVVLLMVFYSYLSDYFFVHNARRLYGYIAGGMAIGAPIGGFGSAMLLKYISIPNLLLVSTLLLGAGNIIAYIIWKSVVAPKKIASPTQKTNPILLKKILTNPYIILIFVIIGIAGICTTIAAYQMFIIASQTLHEKALGNFMGKLFGFIGTAQLIIDFILVGWLMRHLGILKNLFFQPILLFIFSASFIFYPILLFAAAIKFVDASLSSTLNSLSLQMLYLPLPERIRMHSQSLAVGLVAPISSIIGGVILIIFSFTSLPIQFYSVIIFILTMIWVICIIKLTPLYKKTLAASLHQIDSDPQDLTRLLNNADCEPVLTKIFETGHVEKTLVILHALPLATLKKLKPEIKSLLQHPDAQITAVALRIFGEYKSKQDIPIIVHYLSDARPTVRAAAIETYCRLAREQAITKAQDFFKSHHFNVMQASLINCYRYCGKEAKILVISRVKELLISSPLIAAQLIGKIIDTKFESDLITLLSDPNESVRKEAILVTSKYASPKIIENLMLCLAREISLRFAIKQALFSMPVTAIKELEKLFSKQNLPEADRYILLVAIGKIGGESAIKIILDTFRQNHSVILLVGACRALGFLFQQQYLSAATLNHINTCQENILQRLQTLRNAYQEMKAVPETIRQFFKDTIYFYTHIFLTLLSIRYGISELSNIIKIISRSNEQFLTTSFELLETVLPKKIYSQAQKVLHPSIQHIKFIADQPSASTLKNLCQIDPWVRSLTFLLLTTLPSGVNKMVDKITDKITDSDNRYFEYIDIISFLKHIDLFKDIPANYLLPIAEVIYKETYYAGEYIVKEGENGKSLYIIKTGRVDILREQKHITELGTKECIGELSLLDHLPHLASAYVLEETHVLRLDSQDFDSVLETYPEVAESLLKIVTTRLRKTTLDLINK